LLALSGLAAGPARAERGWAYDLTREFMSPWHLSEPLSECNNPNAEGLRIWIASQESLGRTRAEVEAELIAQYGEKIRQVPKAEGRAWLAYAIPALALAAGLAIVVAFLRRQGGVRSDVQSPGDNAAARNGSPDPDLAARVDAEFAAYESADPGE
jgi:cytochrome c-type biogenesis protein CcmH/NrfF